jgi:hypothetical protein
MEHYKYQGSIIQEITKIRSGGASNGVTPISWKMTSLSLSSSYHQPLVSPSISIWNDTIGSSKTVTVEILHDSVTNLKDNEVWLETEYLGNSSFPITTTMSDRSTNIFSTPADQSSSSVVWVTTGLSNPNKQKLEITFTAQMKGWIRMNVCLAKSNYTIYVDPLPIIDGITSNSGYQYNLPSGGYIAETGGGSTGGSTSSYWAY